MIEPPLLHILGKQACKMHSLAKFVFTFSKSREIKYLTAAALAKKPKFYVFHKHVLSDTETLAYTRKFSRHNCGC